MCVSVYSVHECECMLDGVWCICVCVCVCVYVIYGEASHVRESLSSSHLCTGANTGAQEGSGLAQD